MDHCLQPPGMPEADTQYLGNNSKVDDWSCHFKDVLGPPPLLPSQPTAVEVEELTNQVHHALQCATAATMKQQQPYHPKGVPWWNNDCAQVTSDPCIAEFQEDCKCCTAQLRAAARKAKHKWADEVIQKSNLWEVATWHYGRWMNKVPLLRARERLAHDDISCILSDRFFMAEPPPHKLRDIPPFTKKMVVELLANASNHSASGASGQT